MGLEAKRAQGMDILRLSERVYSILLFEHRGYIKEDIIRISFAMRETERKPYQ